MGEKQGFQCVPRTGDLELRQGLGVKKRKVHSFFNHTVALRLDHAGSGFYKGSFINLWASREEAGGWPLWRGQCPLL